MLAWLAGDEHLTKIAQAIKLPPLFVDGDVEVTDTERRSIVLLDEGAHLRMLSPVLTIPA